MITATQTARDLVAQALDALDTDLGNPTVTAQLAAKDQQITTLTSDAAALQAKIDAARTAAQADKDADAASVAGQGVLDALGG